ncbi:MAG TPA: TlpA disulfide reductase family protein [Acidimicrobiia bacterium]|nr:TlpA disulfide reductase family protein [Acidimicrobiia bacterium]
MLALILATRHPAGSVNSAGSAVAASTTPADIAPKKARIGKLAPDFTLPNLDGQPLTLSSLRGRPVVLTFFASWCHPCEQDMPILERAQRDAGSRITVVGVNYQDFPNDTRDFVHRLGVTFPTLIEDSTENPVAARYDVHAMPDTLFIDAHGVVRDRLFGPTSEHDLDSALAAITRS